MADLLTEFIAKRDEIGTKALADILGIKDSAVRMIATGNYPCSTDKILNNFARQFINIVECPFAQKTIERDECKTRSTATKPFGGTSKIAWWNACQHCEHKGTK